METFARVIPSSLAVSSCVNPLARNFSILYCLWLRNPNFKFDFQGEGFEIKSYFFDSCWTNLRANISANDTSMVTAEAVTAAARPEYEYRLNINTEMELTP